VLVFMVACTGIRGPIAELVHIVKDRTGQAVVDCGGSSFKQPDAVLDVSCKERALTAMEPVLAWEGESLTDEGEPLYFGTLIFWLDDAEHRWGIVDFRADSFGPGLVCVTAFVNGEEQTTDCDEDGWDL